MHHAIIMMLHIIKISRPNNHILMMIPNFNSSLVYKSYYSISMILLQLYSLKICFIILFSLKFFFNILWRFGTSIWNDWICKTLSGNIFLHSATDANISNEFTAPVSNFVIDKICSQNEKTATSTNHDEFDDECLVWRDDML